MMKFRDIVLLLLFNIHTIKITMKAIQAFRVYVNTKLINKIPLAKKLFINLLNGYSHKQIKADTNTMHNNV